MTAMLRPGLSIPFSIPRRGFEPAASGVIAADGDAVALEFVTVRKVLGLFHLRSPIRRARIALGDLAAIALDRGWFATALRLRVRSLACVAQVPGSASGEVVLHLRRADRPLADELASALGRALAERDLDALRRVLPG